MARGFASTTTVPPGCGVQALSSRKVENPSVISLERILTHGSIPTLPVVAMRLLEMTSNPDVALSDIAELIQNDPGLASKVLKTVNSSFYGLSKPCPSIERAIAMLGLKAVKSLVLGFSMVSLTRDMEAQVDLEAFWKHTIISAVGARQVAKVTDYPEPDEVFSAALFKDIGVLAMLATHTRYYAPLIASAGASHSKLLELERERLGVDHVEIGIALAEQWKMPELIIAGIRGHHEKTSPDHQHQTLVRCLILGEMLGCLMTEQEDEAELMQGLYESSQAWFNQSHQDIADIIVAVSRSSREVSKLLEQPIGEIPSAQELISRANERMFEAQLATQREAEQAQQDAMTDGLTGVPNRKHFDTLVGPALAEAMRSNGSVSVLFSDADKFKFVNDTYGHPCGDAVLVELARRVSETVGDRGTVCRYGGEEFVVILPGMDLEQGSAVGEAIRRAVADEPFEMSGVPGAPDEPLPRTVSVGVAAWSPGYQQLTAEQLVQRADKAVYAAKESGRNNVKRWGVDTGRRAADQRADEAAQLGVNFDALPQTCDTKILLIEDDPLAARLIQSVFEQNRGVSVEVKGDGKLAIEYLRDCQTPGGRNPDLIISDMNIPGYNGLQIIQALRSNVRFQSIPIVVISASLEEEQRQACHDFGVEQIFNKVEVSTDLKAWCAQLIRSVKPAA